MIPRPSTQLFARIRAEQDESDDGSDAAEPEKPPATDVPESASEAVAAVDETSTPTDGTRPALRGPTARRSSSGCRPARPDDRADRELAGPTPQADAAGQPERPARQPAVPRLVLVLGSASGRSRAGRQPGHRRTTHPGGGGRGRRLLRRQREPGTDHAPICCWESPTNWPSPWSDPSVGGWPTARRLWLSRTRRRRSSMSVPPFAKWKGERVERLAGDHVVAAFSAGTLSAVEAEPGQLEWVAVAGGGDAPCPDCEDNGLSGSQQPGEKFPTGHLRPPAHPGCRCLLVRSAT